MNMLIIIIIIIILILVLSIIFIYFNQNQVVKIDTSDADIIIIGLGTAGSIIARRLHDLLPNVKILVLERGQNRSNDPNVYNPENGGIAAYSSPYSQLLKSDNLNVQVTVGTMFGGSSCHNFALTVHGSPEYYNGDWYRQLGLNYNMMIPYIKRVENYRGQSQSPQFRGTSGKLKIYQLPQTLLVWNQILPLLKRAASEGIINGIKTISQSFNTYRNIGPLRASDIFSDVMISSITSLKNIPVVEDYNANVGNCVSSTPQLFVDNVTGLRSSPNVEYLPSSLIKMDTIGNGKTFNGNLQIKPNAIVNKITQNGVEWYDSEGNLNTTNLRNININQGHIVLSAGAIYTPIILQKSGFTNNNIGANLTTHYGTTMLLSVEADSNEDFNFSSGPLAFLPRNSGFSRDWQIISGGGALINKKLFAKVGVDPELQQKQNPNLKYFVFLLWNLKPRTRGKISINKKNKNASVINEHWNPPYPDVQLNLFGDGGIEDNNSDLSNIVDGLRFMYSLYIKMKKSFPTLKTIYPPDIVLQKNDSSELAKYAMDGVSMTDHYSSTCAFGKVIHPSDFSLINGPKNIHICDCSVFSEIPDGNTEFPVCLLAEVAAQRISKSILRN